MRGEKGGVTTIDRRHNKDLDNLKSSLKKGGGKIPSKGKKNHVVFDESANEFFEADYIIVVRDECGGGSAGGNVAANYDEECEDTAGGGGECGYCSEGCEPYAPPAEFVDAAALSPPEGYKDMGLFNRDGTLREQAWWEGGAALLVGERGTVFAPAHLRQLQLLRRLQHERLVRHALCADCGAHALPHHQPPDGGYRYSEEEEESQQETSDGDSVSSGARVEVLLRPRLVSARVAIGKQITAGEERPKINSSQQTTPTEDCPSSVSESRSLTSQSDYGLLTPNNDESETTDVVDGEPRSCESSPMQQRRGGILKGGRLWKPADSADRLDSLEHASSEEARSSTTATCSDEDMPASQRSVRFSEERNDAETERRAPDGGRETAPSQHTPLPPRAEATLSMNASARPNSAVRQLFSSSRPPPPASDSHLVTADSLRAWDAGPRADDAALRRAAERNALRCSLLRHEARKKVPLKSDTSLAERIRLLTCDVDEERPAETERRASPAGAAAEKSYSPSSGSSGSSSASLTNSKTIQAMPPPPDEGKPPRVEARRQFLSTLAPLTACVGSVVSHENFYYLPPGDRGSGAPASTDFGYSNTSGEMLDAPAPDVVAGTPGASEAEDGLAAFAKATAPRTERLRQRYSQESQAGDSEDDEHDDYGFHRRPAVRGIKPQFGNNEILQQMQNQMQALNSNLQPQSQPQTHSNTCARNTNYSWAYYSESNLAQNGQPGFRNANNPMNWSQKADFLGSQRSAMHSQQQNDICFTHSSSSPMTYPNAYQQQRSTVLNENIYQNCSLYANVRCSESNQDLYSSHNSSEHASPMRIEGGNDQRQHRRPESPPPIRNYHQTLLYIPYSNVHVSPQYHFNQNSENSTYVPQWNINEYNQNIQSYYHHQSSSGASTPQPTNKSSRQTDINSRMAYPPTMPLQVQVDRHGGSSTNHPLCPVASARYRTVPTPAQAGGGQQMICYSEKVQAPLYQPAPISPTQGSQSITRGAPEGAPSLGAPTTTSGSITSPITTNPPHNSIYYAMNV